MFKAADPDSQLPACTGAWCGHTDTRGVLALYSPTTIMAIHSAPHNILNILRQIPTEAVREGGIKGIMHAPITASSCSAHHILRPSMFVEQLVRHVGPGRQEHSSGKGGLVYVYTYNIINMPCKCALCQVHMYTIHSNLTSALAAAGCLSKMQLPVFGPSRSTLGPATTHRHGPWATSDYCCDGTS